MEDKLLIRKLKKGSNEALCRIYEKYEEHLLASAISLLYDVGSAEDVVHDVFVLFAQSADKLKLDGNLKGYLTRCVVNLARDKIRAIQRHRIRLNETNPAGSDLRQPSQAVIQDEELAHLSQANNIKEKAYQERGHWQIINLILPLVLLLFLSFLFRMIRIKRYAR